MHPRTIQERFNDLSVLRLANLLSHGVGFVGDDKPVRGVDATSSKNYSTKHTPMPQGMRWLVTRPPTGVV